MFSPCAASTPSSALPHRVAAPIRPSLARINIFTDAKVSPFPQIGDYVDIRVNPSQEGYALPGVPGPHWYRVERHPRAVSVEVNKQVRVQPRPARSTGKNLRRKPR